MSDVPELDVAIEGGSIRILTEFSFMGITVPAGFVCDGQSWCIGEQRAMPAAVIHDLLYSTNGNSPFISEIEKWEHPCRYTRAEADALFRDGLIKCGVSRTQAWIRWAGLRAFGWKAWNEHKRRIENEKNNLTQPEPADV